VLAAWDSLEIAKFVVSIGTPLAVLVLGVYIKRAGQRLEDAQWVNRKLVERRLDLYDEMAPLLNDLFCFFLLVGDFRSITPPVAIERKRSLDRLFHVNKFLFEPEFHQTYEKFMSTCFITNESVASVARPRADVDRQRAERAGHWDPSWEPMLLRSGQKPPERVAIIDSYNKLMGAFASEVGSVPRKVPSSV
jgi:hypothetical protein